MYLSAQTFVFLSVCFIYRELMIAIGFLFPLIQTSNSSMQLCSFLKWAFILTVLDCCLELGAIPVSYKRGCASRLVCDYIPHMY